MQHSRYPGLPAPRLVETNDQRVDRLARRALQAGAEYAALICGLGFGLWHSGVAGRGGFEVGVSAAVTAAVVMVLHLGLSLASRHDERNHNRG